LFGINSENWHN